MKAAPMVNGRRDLEYTVEKEWCDRLSSEDRALLEVLIEGLSESERNEFERGTRGQLVEMAVDVSAETELF